MQLSGFLSAAALSFALLLALLLLVALGWFLVWKCFLSRFRFVRELLGGSSDSTPLVDSKESRTRTKKIRRE